MAAARFTSLTGTVTSTAAARFTSLTGTTASAPAVGPVARFTSLSATTTGGGPAAQFTSLSAAVAQGAGAPTVAAGTDKAVPFGALVHLTASVSITPPATLGVWAWRVLTKSAGAGNPVLSDVTIAAPTFYAPRMIKGSSYTFGVRHTDSAGRVSNEATTTVTVGPAELLFAGSGGWNVPGGLLYATSEGWS